LPGPVGAPARTGAESPIAGVPRLAATLGGAAMPGAAVGLGWAVEAGADWAKAKPDTAQRAAAAAAMRNERMNKPIR
jgi:hypothetical protein